MPLSGTSSTGTRGALSASRFAADGYQGWLVSPIGAHCVMFHVNRSVPAHSAARRAQLTALESTVKPVAASARTVLAPAVQPPARNDVGVPRPRLVKILLAPSRIAMDSCSLYLATMTE